MSKINVSWFRYRNYLTPLQSNNRRPPPPSLLGGGGEFQHQRVVCQDRLNDGALDPPPLPVDQPDFSEPASVRLPEILVNHRGDIARPKRVQVERVLDRKGNRVIGIGSRFGQSSS